MVQEWDGESNEVPVRAGDYVQVINGELGNTISSVFRADASGSYNLFPGGATFSPLQFRDPIQASIVRTHIDIGSISRQTRSNVENFVETGEYIQPIIFDFTNLSWRHIVALSMTILFSPLLIVLSKIFRRPMGFKFLNPNRYRGAR